MFRKTLLFSLLLSLASPVWAQSEAEDVEGRFSILGDWGVSLFSVSSLQNMRPGRDEGNIRSIEAYNYFAFSRRLSSSRRFSVRVPFTVNKAGENAYGDYEPSTWDLQNVHFVWTDYDWGYLGDVDFQGKIKVYLPTSEFAQQSKLVAQLRIEFIAEYTLAPGWDLRYEGKPDFYWQRQTTALNVDVPFRFDGSYAWDPRQTTQQYGLEQRLTLTRWLDGSWGLEGGITFDEGWFYSSEVENLEGRHTTKFIPSAGIKYSDRGFFIRFGVANVHRLESNRGQDVRYFMPENTEYVVMLNKALF